MKTTLQTIFDFILTLASLFFRRKRQTKSDQPVVGVPGCTGSPAPQYGSGTGCCRSDTLTLPPQPAQPPAGPPTGPVNLLGWALIVSAVGGYVYKMLG